VEDLLEQEYFPSFLQSEFNAKHQVDILTGGQVRPLMFITGLCEQSIPDFPPTYILEFVLPNSVMDPKLFVTDPNPTFQRVPDPTSKKLRARFRIRP
jgi:hypothetical protein